MTRSMFTHVLLGAPLNVVGYDFDPDLRLEQGIIEYHDVVIPDGPSTHPTGPDREQYALWDEWIAAVREWKKHTDAGRQYKAYRLRLQELKALCPVGWKYYGVWDITRPYLYVKGCGIDGYRQPKRFDPRALCDPDDLRDTWEEGLAWWGCDEDDLMGEYGWHVIAKYK